MTVCDALLTPADISEQTESIRAKGTLGLNCNWDKMVGFGQQSILLPLSGFSSCGYSSSFHCGIMQRCMSCEGVNTSKDTGQTSMGQWNNRQVACHLICIG